MSQLIFGGLVSTPAPTAPIIGVTFIVVFAIAGVMVGPSYDGMNEPALNTRRGKDQAWHLILGNSPGINQKLLVNRHKSSIDWFSLLFITKKCQEWFVR